MYMQQRRLQRQCSSAACIKAAGTARLRARVHAWSALLASAAVQDMDPLVVPSAPGAAPHKQTRTPMDTYTQQSAQQPGSRPCNAHAAPSCAQRREGVEVTSIPQQGECAPGLHTSSSAAYRSAPCRPEAVKQEADAPAAAARRHTLGAGDACAAGRSGKQRQGAPAKAPRRRRYQPSLDSVYEEVLSNMSMTKRRGAPPQDATSLPIAAKATGSGSGSGSLQDADASSFQQDGNAAQQATDSRVVDASTLSLQPRQLLQPGSSGVHKGPSLRRSLPVLRPYWQLQKRQQLLEVLDDGSFQQLLAQHGLEEAVLPPVGLNSNTAAAGAVVQVGAAAARPGRMQTFLGGDADVVPWPSMPLGPSTGRWPAPPVAPEDPGELLALLRGMPPPRRRVVVFKGGGYVYAEAEEMIEEAGLGHVMRLTNLIRKADCVVSRAAWDSGRRANVKEHQSAARKARIPFLLVQRVDAASLVAALRPLLIKKSVVREAPGGGGQASSVGLDCGTPASNDQ